MNVGGHQTHDEVVAHQDPDPHTLATDLGARARFELPGTVSTFSLSLPTRDRVYHYPLSTDLALPLPLSLSPTNLRIVKTQKQFATASYTSPRSLRVALFSDTSSARRAIAREISLISEFESCFPLDIPTIDKSPANLYTFAQAPKPKQTKKYKPVALKVKPVKGVLPEKFRIERKIIGDPLKDMPELNPNPPEFSPKGRYTQERKEKMDEVQRKGMRTMHVTIYFLICR